MGDRAIIRSTDDAYGEIYLQWHGSRIYIEAFLAFCKLKGCKPPQEDPRGMARLCQTIANFMEEDELSIGISKRGFHYEGDCEIYYIEDWRIVGRREKTDFTDDELKEMIIKVNKRQPEKRRLTLEQIENYFTPCF